MSSIIGTQINTSTFANLFYGIHDKFNVLKSAITGPGYTGEFTDPNGLLNLRARLYDPIRGIFLTRDPVEGVPDRVGSRNGYTYVEGNPVNRTDPSGECWNTYPTDDWRHQVCEDAFDQRFKVDTGDVRGYMPEGLEQRPVWGSLTYDAFKESWNRAERIPLGEVAKGGLATTAAAAGATLGLEPSDSITVPTGILITAGVVCAAIAINSIAAYPSYDFAKGEEKAKARERVDPIPPRKFQAPRGRFSPDRKSIIFPDNGLVIRNNETKGLGEAIEISSKWVGYPAIPCGLDMECSIIPSLDDGQMHRVRFGDADVHDITPHLNLEAGYWKVERGRIVPSFIENGNLHLRFK